MCWHCSKLFNPASDKIRLCPLPLESKGATCTLSLRFSLSEVFFRFTRSPLTSPRLHLLLCLPYWCFLWPASLHWVLVHTRSPAICSLAEPQLYICVVFHPITFLATVLFCFVFQLRNFSNPQQNWAGKKGSHVPTVFTHLTLTPQWSTSSPREWHLLQSMSL